MESLGQEVHILSQLSHRNIVRFYGVFSHVLTTPSASKHLQFGIVTEFCENGSLYDLLARIRPQIANGDYSSDEEYSGGESEVETGGLEFANILQWATDIARGMNYLHSEAPVQIIHRDLKSTNVLLSRDWMCKICDFGSSRTRNRDNSVMSVAGTPAWMAPELIQGKANFSSGCDMWSFGVVLWELLTCERPFKGLDSYQVMFVVGTRYEHPPIPESCPPPFQTLLKRCWAREGSSRPSFGEVVVELSKMLVDDSLPSEMEKFTSATARRVWLMEMERELNRVKLIEQSLEERENVLLERERQLDEQKKLINLQVSRLAPTSRHNGSYTPLEQLDVLNWSETDVARWVRSLDQSVNHFKGLGRYANLFEANHISGRRLLLLSKNDLHAMGIISFGHQQQFIDEINFLRIASQMMVDFPPLNLMGNNNDTVSRQNSTNALSTLSEHQFEHDVGNHVMSPTLSSPSHPTTPVTIQKKELLHSQSVPGGLLVPEDHHYFQLDKQEYSVNLAIGMYTFPIISVGCDDSVSEEMEYRVFLDAQVVKEPTNVSPDDAIAITDDDGIRQIDVANVFATVFVVFNPELPGLC